MMNTRQITQTPTGPDVQTMLRDAGIDVRKVVRRNGSGHYVADFFYPEMETPIPPAQVWAQTIANRFGDRVRIISTNDTVATWRAGSPTICASVIFAMQGA